MDADFIGNRRDQLVSRRENRWSMNSQRIEAILRELMKPITSIIQYFDRDSVALLEDYLTETGLRALDAVDDADSARFAPPNYVDLALLLQQSATIYSLKVDFLHQHAMNVSKALNAYNPDTRQHALAASTAEDAGSAAEGAGPAAAGGAPATEAAGPSGRALTTPPRDEFARTGSQYDANRFAREPGVRRPNPTLPRFFMELQPRAGSDVSWQAVRDYAGELIGLLDDFQATSDQNSYGRVEDEWFDIEADSEQQVQPTITMLELQAAIDAAAPPPLPPAGPLSSPPLPPAAPLESPPLSPAGPLESPPLSSAGPLESPPLSSAGPLESPPLSSAGPLESPRLPPVGPLESPTGPLASPPSSPLRTSTPLHLEPPLAAAAEPDVSVEPDTSAAVFDDLDVSEEPDTSAEPVKMTRKRRHSLSYQNVCSLVDNYEELKVTISTWKRGFRLDIPKQQQNNFTIAEKLIRNVVDKRICDILSERRRLRDLEPDPRAEFLGWSSADAAEAAARVSSCSDSDDDGFFEQSSVGDGCDTSRGDDVPRADDASRRDDAPRGDDASRRDDVPRGDDAPRPGLAAEPAGPPWAAWQAGVLQRAAEAEARGGLDVQALGEAVLRALPPAEPMHFHDVLRRTAREPRDVSHVMLATLFLANEGRVRVLAGAPLSLDSFSLQLAPPAAPRRRRS